MPGKQPVVGVGAVVIKDERILLVKRAHPPGQGYWAIPGGRVNFGETLRDAVTREVKEETGINICPGSVVYTFEIIERETDAHYIVIDFNAEYLSGEISAGDDAEQAGWFDKNKIGKIELYPETHRFLKDELHFIE